MAQHSATITWLRGEQPFLDNRYSRAHRWQFDGGLEVPASSSPDVVPQPMSDASAVDPEEAFVASLSSCHMLWFLSLAAKQGFQVDSYKDEAQGTLARNEQGRLAMTDIVLRPRVLFSGAKLPDEAEVHALHNSAHDACFLANSVICPVRCEPIL